jgi:rod shape-determining protein MreD
MNIMYNWFVIITSLIVALLLSLLPMPEWAIWARPAWVLMVLIYWSMSLPHRVGVFTAWVVGLAVDLLNGSLLGAHALGCMLVVYLVSRMYTRLNMYPLIQQGFWVLFFVILYQFVIYCIQGFVGELPASHLYWLSSLSTMLLWPWLYVLMRDCRYRFGVA